MISVTELFPSPPLREYVRSFHYTRMSLGAETLLKPLTARPEQMMQFSLRDPFTVIDHSSGAKAAAPDVVVVGRQTRRNLDLLASGDVVTLTVHFQPTGFYRLFHVPLRHLTDLTPDAVDVVGDEVRAVHDLIIKGGSAASMVGHVERFLSGKLDACRPYHPVQAAAATLMNPRGATDLRTLAADSELSVRQLERTFVEQVGVGPTVFRRIVRFAKALQSKSDQPHRNWAEVAADAGYYDQMHFIRDCRGFGSASPTALMETWMDCRP